MKNCAEVLKNHRNLEWCKGKNVDLVKSFPTNVYLQKSASIQTRTSLSKFGGKFNSLLIRLLTQAARAGGDGLGPRAGLAVVERHVLVAPGDVRWSRQPRPRCLRSELKK